MVIKGITDEDFVNYKLPSMYICTSICSFKCDKESGASCCQNSSLAKQQSIQVSDEVIIERYISNPITKAIVFAGLEPFDQYEEMFKFITKLRHQYGCHDPVVIYTGYNRNEIEDAVTALSVFEDIIIKFGRFRPGHRLHYDEVLGVNLASDNQYAVKIS